MLWLVLVGVSIWAYIFVVKQLSDVGVHDHGAIVWDEFAGFFVTMFMIPVTWQSVLCWFYFV